MSYCRWLEGEVYAYAASGADGEITSYVAWVAASACDRCGVDGHYEEQSVAAFAEQVHWLRARGCEFPANAIQQVEMEARRSSLTAREQAGQAVWRSTILTLYPDMFPGPLGLAIAGRALREGRWACQAVHIRDFATDKHRSVDDTPAGGGAGMVLRADVVAAALDAHSDGRPVLALTPRGTPLTQARVRKLASSDGAVILCGRFEGFDERLFEARAIEEVSIGDYVLSGGEVAALVLLDACVRLLPGVMGAASSGDEESFESGLLEYPHYTRPQEWEGRTIPEVLRSGDHAGIAAWRKSAAERDTRLRRPDLWERHAGARVGRPLARSDD